MPVITVYSTPSCMACRSTQNSFSKQNTQIQKIDITQDTVSYDRLTSMGFTSAPVVEVTENGKTIDIWTGFRPDKISQFSN